MNNTATYVCVACGKACAVEDVTITTSPCCHAAVRVEPILELCPMTVTAEHDRIFNDDEPCDDARGQTSLTS